MIASFLHDRGLAAMSYHSYMCQTDNLPIWSAQLSDVCDEPQLRSQRCVVNAFFGFCFLEEVRQKPFGSIRVSRGLAFEGEVHFLVADFVVVFVLTTIHYSVKRLVVRASMVFTRYGGLVSAMYD